MAMAVTMAMALGYAHVCGRSMALFMYDVVGLAGAMVVA